MLIIDRYSYLYSYSSTSIRTRTRTHVIIKYSDSDSYSHILQVLVLVLVLANLVLAPALRRPTIHGLGFVYCIQSAWKKWPTIWHADVSRWLTLSIHGCLWILLLVCLSVHLSVCSFTAFSGGCAFADKSLGTNGIKFDMLMYLLV